MPTTTELIDGFEDEEITTDDEVVEDVVDKDEDVEDVVDKDVDDKPKEDEDEGYFIDDGDEEEDIKPIVENVKVNTGFTPEEQYIIDNLPLISVRVVMADDSIKTFQVRSGAELPRDMKGIASAYEAQMFNSATSLQESRARELQTYYRQNQANITSQEYEKKENLSIKEDVAELQREGEIPKFKAQPGTKDFNADPAAKVIDEVITFMNTKNAEYLEKSNKGYAYKHIGFAEAFKLMEKQDNSSKQNSSARKDAAKKLVSHQGSSSSKNYKPPVSGRTMAELARDFEDFEA